MLVRHFKSEEPLLNQKSAFKKVDKTNFANENNQLFRKTEQFHPI